MADPFREDSEPREISEVNIVPLADVSLVLLIILLVMTPMMTQSMLHVRTAGRAPSGPAPQLPAEPEPAKPPELVLIVDLGPKGMEVAGTLYALPGEFLTALSIELGRRADRKVFLAPHADVTHGQVVKTIELIKSAGAESVALVQTQEAAEAAP